MTRVVVLGAGFGGLEIAATLSERFGAEADVVLIDKRDGFVFGFSKFEVIFGRRLPEQVTHRYADLAKPGVRFVQSEIRAIDPNSRRVETDAGSFEADILVVALGADLDPAATPGLVEAGHEFYSNAGAFALRDVLPRFQGGRVVVGVTSTPFKCPPAPSEAVLLMHDYLTARGLREQSTISLVTPLPVPVPPSPPASQALMAAFADRGIEFVSGSRVERLDAGRRVALLANGDELPFDLFLGVPKHRVPQVVADSGLTVDGWVPVDPATLETAFPNVYAVGDVTSVGTPKAGVFSEGQASVVAERIIARIDGTSSDRTYGGTGTCYVEFGEESVAKVDVTFLPGQAPVGSFAAPSPAAAQEKHAFGTDRIRRWFDREWDDA
ncbi:sulfide:quinone oxidoreductase [Frankineae bacterium MT45]|nr:sulfide:quinone oxidoreductase [Frankineae bacterium MT45]